jgi:glycine/D-amino acid oxidase-like deaminating enzyme
MSKPILIVIGTGVGGISTCYHASERLGEEYSQIVCYDDENPLAASRDEHKIIRYDYADIQTMKTALDSYNMWQTNPDFSGFFQKRLRLVIYKQDDTYKHIKANRTSLGLEDRRILSPPEVLRDYGLYFAEDFLIILNEDDALVRLSDCIKSMRDTCEKRGIKFINEHIQKINFDDGHFSGVTISGREIKYPGGKVVVSPGASFSQLREESNMLIPPRMSMCVQIFAFDIQLTRPCNYPIVSEIGKG